MPVGSSLYIIDLNIKKKRKYRRERKKMCKKIDFERYIYSTYYETKKVFVLFFFWDFS